MLVKTFTETLEMLKQAFGNESMGVKNISRPRKAHQVQLNVKVMLIAFFDYEGVVYHTFVPRGQTLNKEYYLEVLKSLGEAFRKKKV
jgi:hypothetical protein